MSKNPNRGESRRTAARRKRCWRLLQRLMESLETARDAAREFLDDDPEDCPPDPQAEPEHRSRWDGIRADAEWLSTSLEVGFSLLESESPPGSWSRRRQREIMERVRHDLAELDNRKGKHVA